MRLRKLLVMLLTLSMLVSMVPTAAFATGTGSESGGESEVPAVVNLDNLFLDKTAALTDNGTYTINLEAYATGSTVTKTVTEGVPLDVVLVMDQSGSLVKNGDLLTTLKSSVSSFLESLRANGEEFGVNHRVAICGFASHSKQNNSGLAADIYSYANDILDNAWTNTGIFVDGEFRDYGTVEYTEITDINEISTGNTYTIRGKFGDKDIYEYTTVRYSDGAWYTTVNGEAVANSGYYNYQGSTRYFTASQVLWLKYYVYTVGDSRNQLTDADYAAAWENIADGENGQGGINPYITEAVSHLSSNGATATFMGMKMARKMLENLPAEADGVARKKIVIVFTDGEPGPNGYAQGDAYAALAEAGRIKDGGAEIYTIGIYSAASATNVETLMNWLSSNYGDLTYTDTPIRLTTDLFAVDTALSSKGYVGFSANGKMYYYKGIDGKLYALSHYYIKDGEDYWPVCICYDVSTGVYRASYITDDGEYSVTSPNEAKYYQLDRITRNSDPDANYYLHASDISDLSGIFETISSDMTGFTSELSLDANAVLKDVLAEGFTLTDNTTITDNTTVTVSVVPGSMSGEAITWGEPQEVLSFNYSAQAEKSGNVVVNGAADQTEMTLTAKVEGDTISVTGFNYAKAEDADQINAQYISEGHPGSKLVVTITGVEATTEVVTDSLISTNKGTSGIYEGANADADGDGEKGELQASFPVPTTYLPSQVYVMDYAQEMTIDPSDFRMTKNGISLDGDGYDYFNPTATEITETYGKVAMVDGKITYKPANMNWDGFDTFYVFGTTDDATIKAATANENGNMWAKVSVIPANNVYYEDTFVTDEETGTAGIVYSDSWIEDGTAGNQEEHSESEEDTTADGAQGSVHGWEDSLADDNGYSDGSAHMVSYDPQKSATATFTFTGTGVDIYSRTNPTTGIVIAMLYEGASTTDENGQNLIAKYTLMVDNLAASGDYYQIPTLSLCEIPSKDENGNIVMVDMPHGTYTVKIIVAKASASQTDSERFIYYLDGIRVYNPIRNLEGDETVSGAYGDEELNATFVEIRDKLLDANSFSAEDDGMSAGPVFIDRITDEEGNHTDNTETWEVGTYKVFGPENEVYLSAMQMIAFAVQYREGAHYYIGMKSLTGDVAGAIVSTPGNDMDIISVGHTTDLYYEVTPVWTDLDGNYYTDEEGNRIGIIIVQADFKNGDYAMDENGDYIMDENGDFTYEGSILALTKLKVTGPAAEEFKFAKVRNSLLLSCAAEERNTDTPEVEDPTEPSAPNFVIDNPKSATPEEGNYWAEIAQVYNEIKRLFTKLSGWFNP